MKNNFKFLLLAGLITVGLYSHQAEAVRSASCDQAIKDIDKVKPKDNELLKSKSDYEKVKKIVESIIFDKKLVADAVSKMKSNPTREDIVNFSPLLFGQGCLFVKANALKYLSDYVEQKDLNLKSDFDTFYKKHYRNTDQQAPALVAVILHVAALKVRTKLIGGANDPMLEETNSLINEIKEASRPLTSEWSKVVGKSLDLKDLPEEKIKEGVQLVRKEIELSEKYYAKLQELYKKI